MVRLQNWHSSRNGYQDDFLSPGSNLYRIKMPAPLGSLTDDVLEPDYVGDQIIPYINYSVLMSRTARQAVVSAANSSVDPSLHHSLSGSSARDKGRYWFIDNRVGRDNQIPNKPYKYTMWDRGHLTRRSAVAWAADIEDARDASNDSCAYTNACMQHKFFNEDEWRIVETLVSGTQTAKDDKLVVMTGPIFTRTDRYFNFGITDDTPTRIPAGFWKIVSFVVDAGKPTERLITRAFVMLQDTEAMGDRDGRENQIADSYLVTTTEVEMWSGLLFDEKMYASNPLEFESGPESAKVSKFKDLGLDQRALTDVFIATEDSINKLKDKANRDVVYNRIREISWID